MKKLIILTIIAAQILLLAAIASAGDVGDFARTMNPNHLGLHNKKEKLTHIKVYWHDSIFGPNASTANIHKPLANSTSFFGALDIMDDPLTVDVSKDSTVVGHAQGIYAAAGQREIEFLMVMNFAFMTGKYNGSTITILGRNVEMAKVREMPIVGGSGIFRFARGYVEARSKALGTYDGIAIVEYNCYVLHF